MSDFARVRNELQMLLEYTPNSSDLDDTEKEEATEGLQDAMKALVRLEETAKLQKEQIDRYLLDRDNLHVQRDALKVVAARLVSVLEEFAPGTSGSKCAPDHCAFSRARAALDAAKAVVS